MHARRHFAELERNRLMLADRLAEGLALLRIRYRFIERRLCDADATRGHIDAAEFEPVQDLLEAAPFSAADQPRHRHPKIREGQFARIDALVAELRQLAAHFVARSLFDQKKAHAAMPRLGLRIGFD